MSYKILENKTTADVTMTSVYVKCLKALMAENPAITQIESDLGNSLLGGAAIKEIKAEFPKQFVDCGIQEANMIGVACGMSLTGRIPFAHSFAAFVSRRATDQAFISGAYAGSNVRIVGTDPGVSAQLNGGTHMPFEDVAIFRAFPNMTVIEPSDPVMLEDLMGKLAANYGMYYLRLFRKNALKIYEEGSTFEIGKANLLREGKDLTIITAGAVMMPEVLKAADDLAAEGIETRILDMFTIKPIDADAILAAAAETGAIVTAENHNVINGLGSAVTDVLMTKGDRFVPVEMIGVQDKFGQVGPLAYLKEAYHLTAADIVEAAKKAVARKH